MRRRSGTATTAATGDPAVGDGFYALFLPGSGRQQVTLTDAHYPAAPVTATVTTGAVTPLNVRLASGRLQVTNGPVTATAVMGSAATRESPSVVFIDGKLYVAGTLTTTATPSRRWRSTTQPPGPGRRGRACR
jgi:hypothetical protein